MHNRFVDSNAVPEILWTADQHGKVEFVNNAWLDFFSLRPEQTFLAFWQSVVHPDDRPTVHAAWRQAISSRQAYETRARYRRADGSYRWLLNRANLVRNEERDTMQWIGLITDIHEHQQHLADTQSESELSARAIADSLPNLVWISDAAGMPNWYNKRWTEYVGFEIEISLEQYQSDWNLILHPEDSTPIAEKWRSCVAAGTEYLAECRMRGKDNMYRWFLMCSKPVYSTQGQLLHWIGTATNIDEQKRSETRLHFLADATQVLASSLNVHDTLDKLTWLAVPHIADWCAVFLLEEDGTLPLAALAHENPEMLELAKTYVSRYPAHESEGNLNVVRTRQSILLPHISDEMIANGARSPEHLAVLKSLDLRSAIIVPIATNDRILGIFQLVSSSSARVLNESDLQLAEMLAARAATALQNARIFERELEASNAFQHAALPKSLPEVPGLRCDGVYEPGKTEAQVGGDWYDALRLADGRIVISIGDVAGSGLQAAVIMASMRQVIRGVAQVYADPKTLVEAADRTLKAEHPDRQVTAFVAVYDPVAHTLAYTSAGHPRPYLRHHDGHIEELSMGGLPLGLRQKNDGETTVVAIPPGSTLIMYTDGLIESTRDILDGEKRVMSVLMDPTTFDSPDIAREIYARVLTGRTQDDVVIFVIKFVGTETHASSLSEPNDRWFYQWAFDSSDALKAQEARKAFAVMLTKGGIVEEDVFAAELVFGELLSNVVRYAPGQVEIVLDWTEVSQPTLHVLDRGTGFLLIPALPSDCLSENGRGLFLIWTISQAFNVTKRADGGSHARAVLPSRSMRLYHHRNALRAGLAPAIN